MKVEIEFNNKKHACTGCVMSCDETGRAIASFWHESDAMEAISAINNYNKLKSDNKKLYGMLEIHLLTLKELYPDEPISEDHVSEFKAVHKLMECTEKLLSEAGANNGTN